MNTNLNKAKRTKANFRELATRYRTQPGFLLTSLLFLYVVPLLAFGLSPTANVAIKTAVILIGGVFAIFYIVGNRIVVLRNSAKMYFCFGILALFSAFSGDQFVETCTRMLLLPSLLLIFLHFKVPFPKPVIQLITLLFLCVPFKDRTQGEDFFTWSAGTSSIYPYMFSSAHQASFTLALLMIIIWEDPRTRLYVKLLALTPSLAAVAYTGVRLGFISFFSSASLSGANKLITKRDFSRLITLSIVFGLMTATLYLIPGFSERIGDQLADNYNRTFEQTFASGRLIIWSAYIDALATFNVSELLIGKGQTNTLQIIQGTLGYPYLAHNSILEMLTSTGIIGLCLYIYYYFLVIQAVPPSSQLRLPLSVLFSINAMFQGLTLDYAAAIAIVTVVSRKSLQ